MPFGINNPLPSSVASECRKCGKILASFVDPRQAFGPDKVIPPHILANAKGLAILTVLKAGFIGSGRYGNGVVVARTANGSWSAPSAVQTGGAGFGGQIGFELTDFVFILNDAAAVRSFSQQGSITLGGNVSIAAGPVGRNAEAAGTASLKGVAGVFAYSKTKGLFAGVSLEGSMIIERRKANRELYNMDITAKEILDGKVEPPQAAAPLMSILNSRVFDPRGGLGGNDYNDVPVYDDRHDGVVWEGRTGNAYGEGIRRTGTGGIAPPPSEFESAFNAEKPKRSQTWGSDTARSSPRDRTNSNGFDRDNDDYRYSDDPSGGLSKKAAPGRPSAPKPNLGGGSKPGGSAANSPVAGGGGSHLRRDEVVAQFTFESDTPGDLTFKKGDVIQVTKRTESDVDWWTGIIGTRTGIFPSNYVAKQ